MGREASLPRGRRAAAAALLPWAFGAHAATYSLPAGLGKAGVFSSCNGVTLTCSGNIDFGNDNNVVLNITTSMTLRLSNGNFQAKNNMQVNSNGHAFTLQLDNGNFQVGNNFSGTLNIVTLNGNVTLENNGSLTGNVTASGNIELGANTTVNGVCNKKPSGKGTCTGSGTAEKPSGFNAVDAGGNAVSGVIKTKIAGQAISLDIVALNQAGTATLPSYTGTVSLYLVNAGSGGACSSLPVVQSLGSLTFNGAGGGKDNGRKNLTLLHGDALANARLRMVDSGAGITTCSTDAFAIRPHSLAGLASAASAVTASDADWETAGTGRNLNNGGASGGVTHKAGRPFTLRARAWSATGASTPGYTGTPSLSLLACVLPGVGCVPGSLAAGTVTTSSGLASSSTASYSEVGAISARLSDSAFAAVDAGDGSSLAERTVESAAFTIGRFVPDHFEVSANTPVFDPGCGTFTYLGQPFGFGTAPVWTATARNAANATTLNYGGDLFKLAAAGVTGQAWSASTGSVGPANTLPEPVVTDLGNGQGRIVFAVGDGLRFARTALTAPFSASLSLSASIADSEGVAAAGNPHTQSGIGFSGGHDSQVFGRLRLANAHGSELLPLPVPLSAQYWNGSGFVTRTADQCTTLASPALSFFTQTADNRLASGETGATLSSPLAAGQANLVLSAPGTGNFGYLDLAVAAPDWLKYDWDGTDQGGDGELLDDAPRGRASFGRRNTGGKIIFRREIY